MFITIKEVFDVILMTVVVGFIFMQSFKKPRKLDEDVLERYTAKKGFDWHDFWFAAMVTAPAIILHEIGHKILALSYGFSAEFNAAYPWLAFAIILRLINFPFIFFVPAYVSISGGASTLQAALISAAGPGVNLILFILGWMILKYKTKMKHQETLFWTLTKNINLFLFIFNMIPIPGFDGFKFFAGIWHMIGL